MGRGDSSLTRSETVLGGLATGNAEDEEVEEEEEAEDGGVALRVGSEEEMGYLGGSRACLGRGGSS